MTPKASKGTGVAGAVLADRYRLEEPIAAGGMGEVWRATDTLLERSVAVKLLREALTNDPVVSERFRREALVAAQLSHPNMAGIYDYVKDNGRRGIVMEFVDGETLADRLAREGRIEPGEAVRIVSALLSALQAAHVAGVVHRDVKPGNVMLTAAGGVKVTDFGIARAATDQSITDTGMVIGTAQYLSPEQVRGKQATAASDLYSVGAVLYEMLSGRKPFQAETPLAVAMARLSAAPPPITDAFRRVPKPLTHVVERAMALEPEDRYPSADAMREALEAAIGDAQPATSPVRVDPEPTEVLPTEGAEAATVVFSKPEPEPRISPVAERHRREYRRLGRYALLLALIISLIVLGALALTGGGEGGTATVPQFVGLQRADAQRLADERGLHLAFSEVPSDQPEGEVLTQSVPQGMNLARGETVQLTVSSGVPPEPPGIEIPPLKNEDEENAEEILNQLGFETDVTKESSTEVEEGKVIRTEPPVGTTLEEGEKVIIVVSSGEPGRGKKRGGRGNG